MGLSTQWRGCQGSTDAPCGSQHPMAWMPQHHMGFSTPLHVCQGTIRGSAPHCIHARAQYGAQHSMAWVPGHHVRLSTPLNGFQGSTGAPYRVQYPIAWVPGQHPCTIWGSAPNGMGARATYGSQHPMAWMPGLHTGLGTQWHGCQGTYRHHNDPSAPRHGCKSTTRVLSTPHHVCQHPVAS